MVFLCNFARRAHSQLEYMQGEILQTSSQVLGQTTDQDIVAEDTFVDQMAHVIVEISRVAYAREGQNKQS